VLALAEAELTRAHDLRTSALDNRLVILEQERRGIQADLNRNVVAYRAEHQGKHTRREYDLSDPSGLRNETPARLGDDDVRNGASGMQKFSGEDLFAGERRVQQTKQASSWYAAQTAEKELRKTNAREQKKQHGDLIAEQEQYQNDVFDAQAFARRSHAVATRAQNQHMANERKDELVTQKAQRKALVDAEFSHADKDPFLTEDPRVAVSSLASHRVRPDHYKGASVHELAATAAFQAEQRVARKARDLKLLQEEALVASHHENTRKALEMNAERVEQFRAEQRAAVLATVIGQRGEKFDNDQNDRAERFGSGRFGEAYFNGFGTSAR
jgi:hypothetical protein